MSEHPKIPIFWVGVLTGRVTKNFPYLKGLPPSHHLIGKQPQHQHRWCDVWKMWNGFNGTIECHIQNLKIPVETWTLTCLHHQVWLYVSLFNRCLFTTKPKEFVLILICEISQISVWRNKAFIFFQKSDILLRRVVGIRRQTSASHIIATTSFKLDILRT